MEAFGESLIDLSSQVNLESLLDETAHLPIFTFKN